MNEERTEIHREIALGRKELRVVEDLHREHLMIEKNINYKRTDFEMKNEKKPAGMWRLLKINLNKRKNLDVVLWEDGEGRLKSCRSKGL